MLKQDKYRAELYIPEDMIDILKIELEEREDVSAKIYGNKLVLEANTISKLRGLVNSYLRLMKVIEEVSQIEE